MSDVLERIDVVESETQTDTNDPIRTHIISRSDRNTTANAMVMEARINGTPITALCGYVWVPSRDPLKHPPCPKCVEIFEFEKAFHS